MNTVQLIVALLMPLLLGTAALAVVSPQSLSVGAGRWLTRLGEGWLVGVPLLGILLKLWASDSPRDLFVSSLPGLLAISIVLAAIAIWRSRRHQLEAPVPMVAMDSDSWPGRSGLRVLLILITAHFVILGLQALMLPTLPWDAWTTWIGKPKAWWGADGLIAFQPPDAWGSAAGAGGPAALAPGYPEAVPRYLVLLSSAWGNWNESLLHLLWPLNWLALALAGYGGWRRLGASHASGLLLAYLWCSLPLLDAHLAMAGYLDSWIAGLVLMSTLALMRWIRRRQWQDLGRLLLFGLMLPAVKLEGAVWLLIIFGAGVWMLLPVRWRWGMLLAALVMTAGGMLAGGLPIPAPGMGIVWLRWGELVVPGMAKLALSWHPVLPQVLGSLFTLPNWHLLWWLLPPLLWLRRARIASDRGLATALTLLTIGAGFVFVLFFFTDAAIWAENLTSINRIVLQLAPVAVLLTVALLLPGRDPEPADTAIPSDG